MPTKVEAKRFSGKANTFWRQPRHYELSLRAHFAVNDLIDHFHDNIPADAAKKEEYVKAQKKIYA